MEARAGGIMDARAGGIMDARELETLGWPAARLGEAMAALARKTGLNAGACDASNPKSFTSGADLAAWMEWRAKLLDCEAEPLQTTLGDLEADLAAAHPALLRISEFFYLAVFGSGRGMLRILTPNLASRRVAVRQVCEAIREPIEREKRDEIERLLGETQIARLRQAKTVRLLLNEQLADNRFDQCWILRRMPGARPIAWLREVNAFGNIGRLVGAHTLQYLLWLASWAMLGTLSFEGRMDRGWLWAWALLLMTLVPFRLLTTWLQGSIAIGVGGILKRRLLAGALRLAPEEMRQRGIGGFLGQVFEAEAVETLATSGGVAGLLALIELVIAAFVLGRCAIVLFLWCCLAAFLAWRFLRKFQLWTDTRLEMTEDLVEAMVGHRTRLAQQRRENWHEEEDRTLDTYVRLSRSLDGGGTWLMAAIPRGWLLAGVACLVPSVLSGRSSPAQIAILVGGVLLAFAAFKRLAASFVELAGAWVPWKRISPLFWAASRPERLGQGFSIDRTEERAQKVIEAERLTFRYRNTGNPALQACSLVVRRGERILLEGPSGGGKTTFASLLSGMRQPESGLLLVNGFDGHTIGDKRWRRQVAAAPQFHENHILTETLAFNLLMGGRWPPTQKDMDEAEALCRELGLGDLLDRMPSGLLQMVGEGGWQLSHGERSRIYIARALLQQADLVILDESFAALDPQNLRTALESTLERAETLLVIAHP